MLQQKRPVNIIKSVQKLLDTGQIMEKSSLLEQKEGIVDIKYPVPENTEKITNICTQGSLQKSRKEILKDKSNILEKNIQITKLSEMLAADLISKDKVSEKYWNSFSAEISKKLLLPHQIDLAVLEQENFSAGFSNTSVEGFQFLKTRTTKILSKNSQKIYWKLLQSSQRDTTEEESIKKITRKIRIYPNEEQKKLFAKCFGAHRYFYNKALDKFEENKKIEDIKERHRANTFYSIRNSVIIKENDLEYDNMWMKEIPYDTRQLAIKCFISAKAAALANFKEGNISKFKMKHRSKKFNDDIFYVDANALKNSKIFVRRLGKNSLLRAKKDKEFLQKSDGDFSIIKKKDGKYYICVCVNYMKKEPKKRKNICALDPGVRTFQTMYSQQTVGEFGYNTSKKLYRIYKREDKLKSILSKNKLEYNIRYKLKKRCAELRTKAKCIVDDLHWRTADILTKIYQVILLPVFHSKKMANRENRKMSKTSARLLLGLSHYSFQQKLMFKAKQRGRTVILCKEHYTSKCCGRCGVINENLGSKKIFKCGNCHLIADRDVHAARNILIRSLTNSSGVCDQ